MRRTMHSTIDMDKDGEKERFLKASLQRKQRMERVMYYGGWSFEILTAILSVVDVISDILVAQQFYTEGHMVWFWFVMASLIVSNSVYTTLLIVEGRIVRIQTNNPCHMITLFLLLFPIGQAYPVLQWAQDTFYPKAVKIVAVDEMMCVDDYATEALTEEQAAAIENRLRQDSWAIVTDHQATRDELEEGASSRDFIHRMTKAMDNHFKKHIGFYIETVIESIPQGVIQLLAVTALGQASNVQLLSMCLSLFSIVSKAYIVSKAFEVRVFLFKILLVAHDVFALFYVYSTVVAREEEKETTIHFGTWFWCFGVSESSTVQVSNLSAIWFYKNLFLFWSFAICCLAAVIVALHESRRKLDTASLCLGAFSAGAVVTVTIPGLIFLDGVKLLLVVAAIEQSFSSISSNQFPFYANLLAFYLHGLHNSGPREANKRVAHIVRWQIARYLKSNHLPPAPQPVTHKGPPKIDSRRYRESKSVPAGRQWQIDHFNSVIERPDFDLSMLKVPPMPNSTAPKTWGELLSLHELRQRVAKAWTNASKNWSEAVFVVLAGLTLLIWALGQVFNFFFPFLHVFLYGFARQNLLQRTCLVFVMVSLVGVVVLGRSVLVITKFCDSMRYFNQWSAGNTRLAVAAEIIAQYHRPASHALVLYASISREVASVPACDVVAQYLADNDIDTNALRLQQLRELKEEEEDVVGTTEEGRG